MFNAKVYTVSIPSSGVALEDEHIAREVIARWNIEEGEKHGVVFLTIPSNYRGITPDIYIFAIGNYVDEQKVEATIQTGAKVMLFFSKYQDPGNTIPAEGKAVESFRKKMELQCTCYEYNSKTNFVTLLSESLHSNSL